MAILVNYTFYKNIVVVMAQYFLGSMSQFSGQKLYHDAFYQLYNVIHTSLPIVLFAIQDQDVGKRESLRNPELYKLGHKKEYMNSQTAFGWMLSGFWHAAVVFCVPYYTMSNGHYTHADGKANDVWMVGTVVYLLVICVVNMVVVLESYYWNWITTLGICLSFLGWFVEQGYLSGFFSQKIITVELWGTTERLFTCPMLYVVCLTSIIICAMVDVHIKGVQCTFFPNELHATQAKVLEEKLKSRRCCGLYSDRRSVNSS